MSHSRWQRGNFFRDYDPRTGRYLEPDPIGQAGGTNLYDYVGNDPINFLDLFGLTREDVEQILELVRKTQKDLDVPGSVGIGNLEWLPTSPVGIYNPLTTGIWVDDRFLEELTCPQLRGLVDVIIHEVIHRTRGRWDAVRRPVKHPDIYAEAQRRTEELLENHDPCGDPCGEPSAASQ